jgi:hypothetical protein
MTAPHPAHEREVDVKRTKLGYVLSGVVTLTLVWGAALTIPNTFVPGEVISATEMNDNFAAVATAVSALEAQVAAQQEQLATLAALTALPGRDGYFAYAWINATSPADYYAFNPEGEITMESIATGRYVVKFWDRDGPAIRNVMVAAYGSTSHHCKVDFWSDNQVWVRCFNAAGAAVDSLFTIWVAN